MFTITKYSYNQCWWSARATRARSTDSVVGVQIYIGHQPEVCPHHAVASAPQGPIVSLVVKVPLHVNKMCRSNEQWLPLFMVL